MEVLVVADLVAVADVEAADNNNIYHRQTSKPIFEFQIK
jgi:hypothetical protein